VCPECLSADVDVREYDFGVCPQTGYRDAGQRFRCRACGATGDADDLVPDEDRLSGAMHQMRGNPGSFLGGLAAGGLVARFRQRYAR